MTTTQTTEHDARHIVLRAVGAVGLAGIALVHLLDLEGKFQEVPYMGWMYVGLIVGSLVAMADLAVGNVRRGWRLGAGLALATIVGYAINRTVGMPQATDDIGNWLEPLGLASLFVEGIVVAAGAAALSSMQSVRSHAGVRSVRSAQAA